MGMREWINSNPTVVTGGAVALLVVGLVYMITQGMGGSSGGSGQEQAWYVDLETGELFTDSAGRLPSFESPDGNQAVRAVVFACGSCDGSDRFIGYYLKLSSEQKKDFQGGQFLPDREEFYIASARGEDNKFHRPPVDPSKLEPLKNAQAWFEQGAGMAGGQPRRPGEERLPKPAQIEQAPRQSDVCSGEEVKECRATG